MLTRSAPMKRTPFKAKAKAPERREAKQVQYVARPREVATASVALPMAQPMAQPVLKTPDAHDQRIRDSARGEACTVRIVGACTHDPAHTIWSHAPLQAAGKGRGWKSIDLAGAYCCTACDAVIDGQRPLPPGATRDSVMLDWFMGHMRSLVILKQKGLV